ncbi:MAG: FAD-dependent tricarballylate dehydrogenase TcuA [Methyloligellaceae bacterium]
MNEESILARIPYETWDVLIAGGGNAALCAAITARRAGASVLLVEAAPKFYRGGNTRHTRNLRLAHDEGNDILTGPYREEEMWEDLLRVTRGNTDEPLARMTISRSKQLWDGLGDLGVRFQQPIGGTLSLGRTNAFFHGGGRAMLNSLYITAEDAGVEIIYDTEVVDVKMKGSVFKEATVCHDGDNLQVRAGSFVAAAGGFEANIEWLKESWGDAAENFRIRGTPYNRGSLLRVLLGKGAQQVGEPDQCHAVAIDARAPKYDGGIATRLDCIVFGIVVNRDAQRFYDEGEDFWPKRYAIWGRLVAAQPGQIAYAIIEAEDAKRFMPSIFPAIESPTLEGLAEQIDLNPSALCETVRQFNEAVKAGEFDPTELDDCRTEGLTPSKSHWARRIENGPFQAYPLCPGITFTYLGVRVNDEARIIMNDGTPSPNMFAAGEIMAGNILGEGYMAGIGMTIGSVFGMISGKEAAVVANK